MLPDRDGFDVCREVRATSSIPVSMLTARGEPADRIVGLEFGAADYLPKPFEPRELLARLRAILRRGPSLATAPREQLSFGRLTIDRDTREVHIDAAVAPLTGYQFDLLWLLASNAGRVLSRDTSMERLRGYDAEAFDRSLDVHVSRIRAAIEDDPKTPRRILTVRGAGDLFARADLMRRLYLQIYLAFVGVLLLFGALMAAVWWLMPDGSREPRVLDGLVAEALPSTAPPEEMRRRLGDLRRRYPADIAVFGPDRAPLATIGEALPLPGFKANGWQRIPRFGPVTVLTLDDGRIVMVRPHHRPSVAGLLTGIALLSLALAAGA